MMNIINLTEAHPNIDNSDIEGGRKGENEYAG